MRTWADAPCLIADFETPLEVFSVDSAASAQRDGRGRSASDVEQATRSASRSCTGSACSSGSSPTTTSRPSNAPRSRADGGLTQGAREALSCAPYGLVQTLGEMRKERTPSTGRPWASCSDPDDRRDGRGSASRISRKRVRPRDASSRSSSRAGPRGREPASSEDLDHVEPNDGSRCLPRTSDPREAPAALARPSNT